MDWTFYYWICGMTALGFAAGIITGLGKARMDRLNAEHTILMMSSVNDYAKAVLIAQWRHVPLEVLDEMGVLPPRPTPTPPPPRRASND